MADPRIAVQIAAVDGFTATMTKFRSELAKAGGAIRAVKASDLGDFGRQIAPAGTTQRIVSFEQATLRSMSTLRALSSGGGFSGLARFAGLGTAGAITAGIAGLTQMADEASTANLSLRNTARMAGTSAEGLNSLRGAAVLTGLSTNTVDQAMMGLNKTLGDATFGRNTQAANTMRNLGIDFGNAATGARRAGEVFPEVVAQVQRLAQTDPRAAVRLLDILGMPGDILPLALRGNEALAGLRAEAERLSPANRNLAEASDAYVAAQGRLSLSAKGLRNVLVTELEPGLSFVLTGLTNIILESSRAGGAFDNLKQRAAEALHLNDNSPDAQPRADVRSRLTGNRQWLYDHDPGYRARINTGADRPETGPDWNQGVYDRLTPAGQFMYRNIPGSRITYNRNGGAAGSGPGAGAAINRTQAATEAYGFWTGKGLTPAGAAAMVSMEQAEGGFNPGARGDGGEAHGLFQHHADRRAAILAATGIDMSTATATQQREGMYQEMARGLDAQSARALPILQSVNDPRVAAAAGVNLIERPADRVGESLKRGDIAADWMNRLGNRPTPVVVESKPEEPDLSRGGRLPSLAAPEAPRPPAVSDQGGSTVRIDINHTGVPDGVTMRATTQGGGAEISGINIRRAMPNAG